MGSREENLAIADFNRLRKLIYDEAGINLGAEKKTMLEIRLRRRWRGLEYQSCSQYCEYVFSPEGRKTELVHLIDVVTTNKTDFFREPGHFDFLVSRALPEMEKRINGRRKLLVWSAGCSSGEEPYTIAMVLADYAQSHAGFQFGVLGTDISTAVLDKARRAVFNAETAAAVPPAMRRKYFMRSREPGSELLRIVPELRHAVEFRRVNFMDTDLGVPEAPDAIFCRNVIIYFDRATQCRLLRKLTGLLTPGGYFFAGHSESLQGMDLPLTAAGTSVYRKV